MTVSICVEKAENERTEEEIGTKNSKTDLKRKRSPRQIWISLGVLIIILLVVIAGIWAWTNIFGYSGGGAPGFGIGFESTEKITDRQWVIEVTGMCPSGGLSLSKLRASIKNGTVEAIPPDDLIHSEGFLGLFSKTYSRQYSAGGNTLTVAFTDKNGDGKSNAGDYFTFTFSNTPTNGTNYSLALLYRASSASTQETHYYEIGSEDFTV